MSIEQLNQEIHALDSEIEMVRDQICPESKMFRYQTTRLDVLTLQRDLKLLEGKFHEAELCAADYQKRFYSLELKNSILEMALISLCKPEFIDKLTSKVSEEMCKQLANRQI